MRNLFFVPICFLILLCACNTSNTNPGHHSAEEVANAKPKPVSPAAPVTTPPVQTGESTNGAELFAQYCAVCHAQGKNGPPLEGIMSRREFPSGTPANDVRLRETIKMGRAMMPAFANTLSDEQVDAIVKYVHTL
jgi:mono/diheme cytochrome c family protein